jgi:hypothetical protein
MKRINWIVLGVMSSLIGLYPIIYFLIDRQFGLLGSKTEELLNDFVWNAAFYGHIIPGGLALLIGWLQFNEQLRIKRPVIHIRVGKTYMLSVFISGFSSLYIAVHATGGIVSAMGFFALGLIWLSTTFLGLKAIKERKIEKHQVYMVLSYAACFAAVTLRIWLPILTSITGEFISAYRVVAWLCWVPNIIVALFIISKMSSKAKFQESL